jgi:molecular chaperone GrpE
VSEKSLTSSDLSEILTSNQQGVELIRRSLLELLRQRRVVPITSMGKPFDSQTMYAVGRESRTDITDNTVIQEVVRGYLWGERILREAQVIVAAQGTLD